jgi:hypothetical protein
MNRRHLFRLLVGAPLLTAWSFGLDAASVPSDGTRLAIARLSPEAAAARLIGVRLLSTTAEQPGPRHLLDQTGLDPSWPPDRMRGALAARRARDFADGDTVEVDGWVLARCEAALCMLLAAD